jgi:hypothetical protein
MANDDHRTTNRTVSGERTVQLLDFRCEEALDEGYDWYDADIGQDKHCAMH